MNKPKITAPRSCSAALRLMVPALAACWASLALAQDARDKKPVVMEPYIVDATKTDVLFRGTDISVSLDKDTYPVRDVAGASWVIAINGVDRPVSAKHASVNLKMSTGLKLTEVSARVDGFLRVPGYSFGNDPTVIRSRALMKAAMTNAMLQGVAQDARDLEDTGSNAALGAMALFSTADKQFGDAALMHTAMTTPAITHSPKAKSGSSTPPANSLVPTVFDGASGIPLAVRDAKVAERQDDANASNGYEPLGRMTTQGFDAVNVDFAISSPRTLPTPYVVTIARFHEVGSTPGTEKKLVFAKALDPIDSHPSHVHFSEEGFPFNYEMIEFQVHIYNRGVEIPTNLSADRIDMTRDEAFQYVKMEYIAAHKGATRPPAPAMGKLPSELRTRLAAGSYGDTFYVKVSKDGMAEESFADATCSQKIQDPFLDSVVKSLRFKPALANGAPEEGVAALNLSKLQI